MTGKCSTHKATCENNESLFFNIGTKKWENRKKLVLEKKMRTIQMIFHESNWTIPVAPTQSHKLKKGNKMVIDNKYQIESLEKSLWDQGIVVHFVTNTHQEWNHNFCKCNLEIVENTELIINCLNTIFLKLNNIVLFIVFFITSFQQIYQCKGHQSGSKCANKWKFQ